MELLEQIKSIAKDGTDFTEIETAIGMLNPLGGIKTKDEAWELVKSNKLLLSTYDQKQNERLASFEENLRTGKIATEWAEKEKALRLELNPEESPSDIKIREMAEKIEGMEKEKSSSLLKTELSKKAQELNFDPVKAQDYAVYGETAMDKLESDATWFTEQLESRLSTELKKKFEGNQQPRSRKIPPADLDSRIKEARAAGNASLALRLELDKRSQA